jgi:DNA-binding FadR family transcriptional regulator
MQVKEAILSGAYKQGQRLPSEKVLCGTFQVGRAVVREALRKLEHSGLIHVRSGSMGGAFVKGPDPSALVNTLEGIVRLNNVSFEELTAARAAIETATFRIIVQRILDEDFVRLQRSIDEAREALEMGLKEPKNKIFHLLLAGIARNSVLTGIIEGMLEFENKFYALYEYSYERKKTFLEEHQQVLDLLKEKKYSEAERVFQIHIEKSICLFH